VTYAVIDVTTRTVRWVGSAASAKSALETARIALARTRVPAAWHAAEPKDLHADYQKAIDCWQLEEV
jgi:hypothetical protein